MYERVWGAPNVKGVCYCFEGHSYQPTTVFTNVIFFLFFFFFALLRKGRDIKNGHVNFGRRTVADFQKSLMSCS